MEIDESKIYYKYYIAVKDIDDNSNIQDVDIKVNDELVGKSGEDGRYTHYIDTGLLYDNWYYIDSAGKFGGCLIPDINDIVLGDQKKAIISLSTGGVSNVDNEFLNSEGTYIVNLVQHRILNNSSLNNYVPSSIGIGIVKYSSSGSYGDKPANERDCWGDYNYMYSFDDNENDRKRYISGENTKTIIIHNNKNNSAVSIGQLGKINSYFDIYSYPFISAYGYSYKGLNEWVTSGFNSNGKISGNKGYLSITVNQNSQCIQKIIKLSENSTYKIKIHTYSDNSYSNDANKDGIIILKNHASGINYSSYSDNSPNLVAKVSGTDRPDNEKEITFRTGSTSDTSKLYLYFVTDNTTYSKVTGEQKGTLGKRSEYPNSHVECDDYSSQTDLTNGGRGMPAKSPGTKGGLSGMDSSMYELTYDDDLRPYGDSDRHCRTVYDPPTIVYDGYTYGDIEISLDNSTDNFDYSKINVGENHSFSVEKYGYKKSETKDIKGVISFKSNYNENTFYLTKDLYYYTLSIIDSITGENLINRVDTRVGILDFNDVIEHYDEYDELWYDLINDTIDYDNKTYRIFKNRYGDKIFIESFSNNNNQFFEYLSHNYSMVNYYNDEYVVNYDRIDKHPIIIGSGDLVYTPSKKLNIIFVRDTRLCVEDVDDYLNVLNESDIVDGKFKFERQIEPDDLYIKISKNGFNSISSKLSGDVDGDSDSDSIISEYNCDINISFVPKNSIMIKKENDSSDSEADEYVPAENIFVQIYSDRGILYGNYSSLGNGYIQTLSDEIFTNNYRIVINYDDIRYEQVLEIGYGNVVYLKNGEINEKNTYETFDKESVNSIKRILSEENDKLDSNQNSTEVKYFSKSEGNKWEDCNDFRINISDPDSINVYDIFESKPVMINFDQKDVIGSVDTNLKSNINDLRVKMINRYSGYYNPIFKDVLFYNNLSYKNGDETVRLPFSNTSFNSGYEDNQGKFGVINNIWFHKVNDNGNTGIIKTLTPYYPLLGQYAIDYRDYNIFETNWDKDHYTRQLDANESESCTSTVSMKEGLCMFGSKYLNVPDKIEIVGFEFGSNFDGDWNDDWIKSPYACPGEVMFKELNNNSVNFYFFFKKRILRYFREQMNNENDEEKQIFKKYINENYSFGKPGLDDDIDEYTEKNILNLYKLEKVRVFVRRTKVGKHNSKIENDYKTYLENIKDNGNLIPITEDNFYPYIRQHGFVETDTITMTKMNRDDFDRKIVYNLRNGYKEEFAFSFILKKI